MSSCNSPRPTERWRGWAPIQIHWTGRGLSHCHLERSRETRDEGLNNEELIAEKYRGIRPAPGYPACPDHRVKSPLFELLQAGEVGMTVTESLAMLPAASVSGFYF